MKETYAILTKEPGNVDGNGNLPPAREAIIDQAQRLHQEVAHQRDELLKTVHERDQTITLFKITVEGKDGIINDLTSQIQSARLDRDDAVARAAKAEAKLESIAALVRSFEIPAVPHIHKLEEEVATIGGA